MTEVKIEYILCDAHQKECCKYLVATYKLYMKQALQAAIALHFKRCTHMLNKASRVYSELVKYRYGDIDTINAYDIRTRRNIYGIRMVYLEATGASGK